MIRKVLIGLAIVMIGLQFFPEEKPEINTENPEDLLANHELSQDVETLLRSACYDCHSNETNYPWYSSISPFSMLIFKHVQEGRDELNFSEWNGLRKSRKLSKLTDIEEVLKNEEMPLSSYAILHGEAQLSTAQREQLIQWTKSFASDVE